MEVFKGLVSSFARSQPLTRFVWPRGASALLGSRLFSLLALLAFLETNTEAKAAATDTRGVAEALS